MSDSERYTLEYQLTFPIKLMELKHYRAGNVNLSQPGDKVTVNGSERRYLLKLRNGSKSKGALPYFKDVTAVPRATEITEKGVE